MLEILAPAGNAECAKTAIMNGANAIYVGYSNFSARQSADNFGGEGLNALLKEAHLNGVKVYVAMNTIVKDEELEEFIKTLIAVWGMGADAIILQDVFLGKRIHEKYPEMILHLSTQAGVCNLYGAKFAKECGFSRVILARETPLEEIEKIAKFIETEVFVQGALCTCFSGQCYFSSFAGGNSGNRGRCKQPCRKLYSYDRQGFEEKSYALSLSDLNVGEKIEKLIDAGVVSFKIEGRMRRAEYVGSAVAYYRAILDDLPNREQRLSDLKRTYNRGNYTQGLAFGQDKRFLSPKVQGHLGEKVGVVKVINGKFFVENSSVFPQKGDAFKILRDGKEVGGAFFEKAEKKGFYLFSKTRLKNGDGVFITTDTKVNERVLSASKQPSLRISLDFCEGEYAKAICEDYDVTLVSDEQLQSAENQALTKDDLTSCFEKTDGTFVKVIFEKVNINGKIFIPKSKLNGFRRQFFEKIFDKVCKNGHTMYELKDFSCNFDACSPQTKTAVIATDFTCLSTDIAIFKADDFSKPLSESFINGNFEKYLYFPAFLTEKDCERMKEWLSQGKIDGIYAENYGGICFAKENDLKVFAGTGLNLLNKISISALLENKNVEYYAVSKEGNAMEVKGLLSEKAFVLSSGDIKIMDLLYCPFGKICANCDKKQKYELRDENDRIFPVRRYLSIDGDCRFEVYNCAKLISKGLNGCGKLLDLTMTEARKQAVSLKEDEEKQKEFYKTYTSGHLKRGIL